jgi:hypothetical protein
MAPPVWLLTAALTVGPAALTRRAAAQTEGAGAAPLSDTLTGATKADYDEARELLRDGDFVGALVRFERVYKTVADPRVLANVALCEKNLGHAARAATLLERAIKEGAHVFAPEQRPQLEALREACLPLIARRQVTADVPGAQLFVDEHPVDPPGSSFDDWADRGPHRLRISKEGYGDFVRDVALGAAPLSVRAHLVRNSGEGFLRVTAGADDLIAIDGRDVGKGGWAGRLGAGVHPIVVTRDGWEPYRSSVTVLENQTHSVEVTLAPDHRPPTWLWVAAGTVAAVAIVVAAAAVFHSSSVAPPAGASAAPPRSLGIAW